MTALYKGIDVSKHNGTINWTKVKSSGKVDFAILRCGYGRENAKQIDEQFENNYKGCKSVGIPVGVYHYSYAMTEADALKEAEFCYKLIKGKQFEFPIFYDIEESKQIALGKEKVQAIAKAFCNYLETKGYWVGLYSMDSAFTSILDTTMQNRYGCWVARVENVQPKCCKTYGMWQYSWKGKINGINTDVDMNYCYVDYPTLIKQNGKNGYSKGTVNTKPTTNTTTSTTNKTYTVPKNITFATDVNKNVITTYSYKSHKDKQLSNHFAVYEFASWKVKNKTLYSNNVKIHNKLIQILEIVYAELNCSKIIINSGYRTSTHDKAVGGDGNGQHTLGRACDFTAYDKNGKIIDAKKICCLLEDMGVWGIGYISPTSVHCDTRAKSKQWWGDETKAGSPNILKMGYKSFHDYFNM